VDTETAVAVEMEEVEKEAVAVVRVGEVVALVEMVVDWAVMAAKEMAGQGAVMAAVVVGDLEGSLVLGWEEVKVVVGKVAVRAVETEKALRPRQRMWWHQSDS